MEYVCPVCNGLQTIKKQCPNCGGKMEDKGIISDFFGPYSPYEDRDTLNPELTCEIKEPKPCAHLFSCNDCGYDCRLFFDSIRL